MNVNIYRASDLITEKHTENAALTHYLVNLAAHFSVFSITAHRNELRTEGIITQHAEWPRASSSAFLFFQHLFVAVTSFPGYSISKEQNYWLNNFKC